MSEITISSKYQIVIPKEIREELALSPGQKIRAVVLGNRIELVPVRDISEARGFLKGLNTDEIERESDRL